MERPWSDDGAFCLCLDGGVKSQRFQVVLEKACKHMPNRVVLNADWCKGCHICVAVCPHKVLEVDEDSYLRGFHPVCVARPEDCTVCQQCEMLCPDLAIMVTEEDA